MNNADSAHLQKALKAALNLTEASFAGLNLSQHLDIFAGFYPLPSASQHHDDDYASAGTTHVREDYAEDYDTVTANSMGMPQLSAAELNTIKAFALFSESYKFAHGWISLVLCFFGALMNIMNVVVLTRPSMINSVNVILTSIALCDVSLMFSTFLTNLLERFVFPDECSSPERWTFGFVVLQIVHGHFSIWMHCVSLWLAVVLTVARFFTLQSSAPAGTVVWSKLGFMLRCCCVTALLCAIASLPAFLMYTVSEVRVSRNDTASYYCLEQLCHSMQDCDLSSFRPEAIFPASHTLYSKGASQFYSLRLVTLVLSVTGILHKIAPCILLAIFMALLVKTLLHADKRHRRLVGGNRSPLPPPPDNGVAPESRRFLMKKKKETKVKASPPSSVTELYQSNATVQTKKHSGGNTDRTTTMLVFVVLIFIVCELPQGILLVLCTEKPYYQHIYHSLGDILDLLSMINSSVNFILYCIMSKKFRDVFCEVFVPCCVKYKSLAEVASSAFASSNTLAVIQNRVRVSIASYRRTSEAEPQVVSGGDTLRTGANRAIALLNRVLRPFRYRFRRQNRHSLMASHRNSLANNHNGQASLNDHCITVGDASRPRELVHCSETMDSKLVNSAAGNNNSEFMLDEFAYLNGQVTDV